jgi:hypothetical protein
VDIKAERPRAAAARAVSALKPGVTRLMFTPWQRQKRARIEYQRYVIIDRWDTKECLTCFTSATIAPRSPTAAAHCRLQELAATTSTTSITATYKTCRDSMPVTVERLKE